MSAARNLPSEDQFLCSICLDVFTDPVTIPCGHNFCKSCITEHWDTSDQYLCPLCKKAFTIKPDMKVSAFISGMVAQFRQSAQQKTSSSSSERRVLKPGEVPCDVCTGTKSALKRVQQYAADVTLDPDTAHPDLILSEDGKQVHHGDVERNLPYNPKRFTQFVCVLAKQSFSSGRFYFEVEVKGKTEWDLGVVKESIYRKELIPLSPDEGRWSIMWLVNGNEYKAFDDPPVCLPFKSRPQKVGVFVDYEEGLVSFYDVDAAALIYSFTGCSFTEKLFPYFNPCQNYGGKNSAPLIISPVNQAE